MISFHGRYVNIGAHVCYSDSLTDCMITTVDLGMYSMCFSLGTSRNLTRKRVDTEDLVTSMGISTRFPLVSFSLIPTMYNLCGSRNVLAWNGNESQDIKSNHINREIEYELYTLAKLGGSCVIELGSYRDGKDGRQATVKSLNAIKFKLGCKLVLINSLDVGFNVGVDISSLHHVYKSVDARTKQHLQIGFNLAYFFVNGLYDFRQPSEIQRLFKDYAAAFDDKYLLSVIVLTDCVNDFGSREYGYESVGQGRMWTDCEESLYTLISLCHEFNTTILTMDNRDMELVREMTYEYFS